MTVSALLGAMAISSVIVFSIIILVAGLLRRLINNAYVNNIIDSATVLGLGMSTQYTIVIQNQSDKSGTRSTGVQAGSSGTMQDVGTAEGKGSKGILPDDVQ